MNLAELGDVLRELLYPVPNSLETLEQRDRYELRDISRMSRPELLKDRDRLKLRLLLEDVSDPWLSRRLAALQKALNGVR